LTKYFKSWWEKNDADRTQKIPNMKKNKPKIKLTDILLLTAAHIFDFYQEIKDPFNLVNNYYEKFYGTTPSFWRKSSFRRLFHYCLKKKYFTKESDIKKGKFILSKEGLKILRKKYPTLYYRPKNWDKKIRLVIFDIYELERTKRNQLRKLLKQLGFIMLQKSVWISPFNQFEFLDEFLNENNLHDKVILIEVEESNIKNKKKINKIFSKLWQDKL
jgi:phenylacetic acid degradation operon negative regulatory protein